MKKNKPVVLLKQLTVYTREQRVEYKAENKE